MRLAHQSLQSVKGVEFYKLLGCGGGKGFSVIPNWGMYALLVVWKNQSLRLAFENKDPLMREYLNRATSCRQFFLHPIMGHGSWNGQQPFNFQTKREGNFLSAIITRASIRRSKLLDFWSNVRGVSNRIKEFPESKFAIGIGEYPLIEQATFSIWESEEQMKKFAYQDKKHQKVIELTRARNWYSEELFARFQLIEDKVW